MKSNSDIVRLFKQGAVSVNGVKVFDIHHKLKAGDIVKVGKRDWFRITP